MMQGGLRRFISVSQKSVTPPSRNRIDASRSRLPVRSRLASLLRASKVARRSRLRLCD
jgi:hypothetical protein